jgi:hypothetical protein
MREGAVMFKRSRIAVFFLVLAATVQQGHSQYNTVLGSGAGNNEGAMPVYYNTAIGNNALYSNLFGSANTAIGSYALYQTGDAGSPADNTGVGEFALYYNSQGNFNTAVGGLALGYNFEGNSNTAMGYMALYGNWNGNSNVAVGYDTMPSLSSGIDNVAIGAQALQNASSGSQMIAIGASAGANIGNGSADIEIGNPGASTDNGVIRIGNSSLQSQTYIAGIRSSTTGVGNAIEVVIDSNGQLGTRNSSRRLKTDITDMGDTTSTLMGLRPVRYRYISQGANAPVQYGLIAEEVAGVAPELVATKPDGEVETVFYDKVNALLLNTVQKQQHTIEDLEKSLTKLESRLAALEGSEQR